MKKLLAILALLPCLVLGQTNYGSAVDTATLMGQGSSLGTSGQAAYGTTPTTVPSGLGGFSDPNAATQNVSADTSQGGLTSLGQTTMAQCANYVPGANAMLDQQCASVNFMANNCLTANSAQQAIIGGKSVAATNGVNCTGSYGAGSVANSPYTAVNGVTSTTANGSAAQILALGNIYSSANAITPESCNVQTVVTTPAQFTTYQCVKSTTTNQVSCSQNLATTVTTNKQTAQTTYSCSGGTINGQYCEASSSAPAPIQYSCAAGQTLSGSNCINPNGSVVPASIASYGCPAGQSLQGTTCVQTTTNTAGANVGYSCSSGTVSGSSCVSTSTSGATPNYYCPNGGSLSGTTCYSSSSYGAAGTKYCPEGGYEQGGWCNFAGDSSELSNNLLRSITYGSPFAVTYADVTSYDEDGLAWFEVQYGPAPTSYTCPSGGSLSGTTCTTSSTAAATIGSYSCAAPAVLSGNSCVTTTTSAANITYSCNSGGVLSGSQCTYTTTSTSAATPNYSCPSGYSLSGTSCVGPSTIAATINYTCPTGATLSGSGANSICTTVTTTPATVNYSCADGSAPQNGMCIIYSVTSSWQDNCTAYENSAGSKLGNPQ